MNKNKLTVEQSWWIASMAVQLHDQGYLSRKDLEGCLDDYFARCEEILRRRCPETAR